MSAFNDNSGELFKLFMTFAFSISFGMFTQLTFKSYGILVIPDDSYLTEVGQLGFLLSGIFYIIWWGLYQLIGFKRTYYVILMLQILITTTYGHISASKALFKSWVSVSWISNAGQQIILMNLIYNQYNIKIGN